MVRQPWSSLVRLFQVDQAILLLIAAGIELLHDSFASLAARRIR
jgi:hypothetical protein